MKTYITFGQVHYHKIDNRIFDKDCVAVIEAENASIGREIAFKLFGNKFCFSYTEDTFDYTSMKFFPRGFIQIDC